MFTVTCPKEMVVALSGGFRFCQVTVIEPGPPDVSTLVGLGKAASLTNASVPVKAGAELFGVIDRVKDRLLSVTPLSRVNASGTFTGLPGSPVVDAAVSVATGGL